MDKDNVYKKLIDAVETLPKEAVERTKKEITRKGYDTTGYQYQYLVNVMNEVLGIDGWGFDFLQLNEQQGTYNNGKSWHSITVSTTVWVRIGENKAVRSCVGGHKSELHSDAFKGAITNALKKTLGFFGVGKCAYEGTIDEDYRPLPNGEEKPKQPQSVDVYKELSERTGMSITDIKKKLKPLGITTEQKIRDIGGVKIIKILKGETDE
jgi:recombination DNA repair RAD52 pathway protein